MEAGSCATKASAAAAQVLEKRNSKFPKLQRKSNQIS